MSDEKLICGTINNGDASRYIKPRWLDPGGALSTEAFDLREGPPPETYVSHFMVEGDSLREKFKSAYTTISAKIKKCHKGSIAILNIQEVLTEVNDEAEPFIAFIDKGLPHCGLIYTTSKQEKIQEAKATLCIIAKNKITLAQKIQDEINNTKKLE